ncbi:MAG: hypothetical protein QOH38_1738, partial [Thermoleophilaceae bacterium]|nr:hypothetical protein [Thermoleophilaceae bacterium]
ANDRIYAHDGEKDRVDCGSGDADVVFVDPRDVVVRCEHVIRRP